MAEELRSAGEELLSVVMENAPSIVFGLQTYAYELRRSGDLGECERLLSIANSINSLFYMVYSENK